MEPMVDVGHEYRPGRPVRLLVTERELNVDITRHDAVWLPVVPAGPGLAAIVARIGEASLRFYDELLDLASALEPVHRRR